MLLMMLYEVLVVVIPVVVAYAIWVSRCARKNTRPEVSLTLIVLFSFYLSLAFLITGSGTIFDFLRFQPDLPSTQVYFAFFADRAASTQNVLNAVLFIPLGFLVSWISKSARAIGPVALYGIGLSLLIEISQMLNYRVTDIDDIIMNLLGALLGYGIYLCIALLRKETLFKTEQKLQVHQVLMFIIGIAFLSRFFFFNPYLLMGIIR